MAPDPPGKVLSSPPPSSDKCRSKLGICAGLFVQLFDWNRRLNGKRLLPHKSAERPSKRGTRCPKDDKLPMAKLLLITDENRGGFPRALQKNAGDSSLKGTTTEKKNKKKSRSPSVVAKLMGLETMPSPEPLKNQKRSRDFPTRLLDENLPRAVPDMNLSQGKDAPHSSSKYRSVHMKPPHALVSHKSEDPKVTYLCKLPALSPCKADGALRSILSPSKSHNKLLSPIKSPLATRSAARLLGAAAKILEPNMQPSICSRARLSINSKAAKSLLSDEDQKAGSKKSQQMMGAKRRPASVSESKKHPQSVLLRPYTDQSKCQNKVKQDKHPGNVSDVNATCKSQPGRAALVHANEYTLGRTDITKDETLSPVNGLSGQHRLILGKSVKDGPGNTKLHIGTRKDVRIGKEDKGKSKRVKQQPETINRPSQSGSSVKKRCVGTKHGVYSSSLDRTMLDVENQDPNRVRIMETGAFKGSSANSTVTCSASSGIIQDYGRLFSSRKGVTGNEPTKKTPKRAESLVMRSFPRKRAFNLEDVSKSEPSVVPKDSQSCKGEDNNHQIPSALDLRKPHTSEDTKREENITESEACNFTRAPLVSSDFLEVSISAFQPPLEVDSSKDRTNAQDNNTIVQSSCESSAGEVDCSASSSSPHIELANYARKRPVSYSGKTTGAIIQELVMALNSANTQLTLEDSRCDMPVSNDSICSSKFSLCTPDCEDSASSANTSSHHPRTGGGICMTEWRHSSPVSTLEAPFEDESSTTSECFDNGQEGRLLSRVTHGVHHELVCRRHGIDVLQMQEAYSSEEQYVKEVVGTAKLCPVDIYAADLQLPCPLVDPALFRTLEDQYHQQWEWGVGNPGSIKPYGICISETEMCSIRSFYAEVGVLHRKLVFESIIEALHIQFGVHEWHSCQSFPSQTMSSSMAHIFESVCRQIDAWKGLACCINIDDMVDHEMNSGFGKWVNFSEEVSEVVVEMESSLMSYLVDELVNEVSRISPIMIMRQGSRKDHNRKERVGGGC